MSTRREEVEHAKMVLARKAYEEEIEPLTVIWDKPTEEEEKTHFNIFPYPDGPWVERPPTLNKEETLPLRKVLGCYATHIHHNMVLGTPFKNYNKTGCWLFMGCGNKLVCGQLFKITQKIVNMTQKSLAEDQEDDNEEDEE